MSSFYHVGDERIEQAFGSGLPAELADLVDVALAVYVADRLSPRRPQAADRYNLHWTRQLDIRLPLRDPDRWVDSALRTRLSDVLAFFTEDEWSFHFVPLPASRRQSGSQGFLFRTQPSPPVTAALFSGGVDSLAGLCREVADRPAGSFVLFSASTNQRIGAIQRDLAGELRERLGREILPVVVPFGFCQRSRSYDEDEPTQRSRGFVFLALGAVTAMMAGAEELAVYESGVGAINLPYTDAQLGTHNTRATDPRALVATGDFISAAVGRRFAFRSPFVFATKGEICSSLSALGLGDLAGRTISCESFPVRVAGRPQCGLCTSCLLRRQSLFAAGLGAFDVSTAYRDDVMRFLAGVPERKLYALRAMLDQVARIRRALDLPERWGAISRMYPQLAEVAATLTATGHPPASVQAGLVDLYRRYCNEWDRFPARPPGWTVRAAA